MKSIFANADQEESAFFTHYDPLELTEPIFTSVAYICNTEQSLVKYDLTLHKDRSWLL